MFPHKPTEPPIIETRDDETVMDHEPHHDKYGQYSHEMTDETAEASARFLIRAVPLAYGAILGGLIGNLALGVLCGLGLTMALDMKMGRYSIFRPLLSPLTTRSCPVVAAVARGLADGFGRVGLPSPSALRHWNCGVPHT